MKKTVLIALALAANATAADFSIGASAGVWNAEPSGNAAYKGDSFDLKNDAGLKKDTNFYVSGYLEHAVPVLPNLLIERIAFSSSGTGELDIDFGGKHFSGKTETSLDLNHLYAIGYYLLPVPVVDLRLGLGADMIDGSLEMHSVGQSEKADLSAPLPVAYAGFGFDIGAINLSFLADAKYLAYDGSHYLDAAAKVGWAFVSYGADLLVEVGYRHQELYLDNLDAIDANTDIKISGVFGGLSARY
ncbi:hypothetical protein AGMMS50229_11970 [Campylobacterota bacterium]|nr:hypothetical protein AGMMS50229_11970 [Campylobacterota bacterium]